MPFGVDETRAAVIAIDLHRGHLDPGVATMPVPSGVERQVIEANRRFFDRCREVEIPIVHLVTQYRDVSEIRTNPFWRTRADDPDATRKNVERHNIEGSPGCEIIPVLWDKERDWVVDTKKRYNCFVATDLDFVLRKHGINTVLLTGVERQVIEANRRFFDRCREVEIPIVHLVTKYRDVSEIRTNPFWRTRADDPDATRKNVERHNIEGSPGCEIIPVLWDKERDWVVDTKKRYNCFVATDLDFVLRKHGINTVLLTGVNTNSCVLSTATTACSRDYAVFVVEDCVDTMDGPELHEAAIKCIRAAFGWVMTSDEVVDTLKGVTV